MEENQHRWREWLDDPDTLSVLEQAAKTLKWAWDLDNESRKSYPMNTVNLLLEIDTHLQAQSNENAKQPSKLPFPPEPPKNLAELVSEQTIKLIYEDQNEGSYEQALKDAAREPGVRTWRKILRAIGTAYVVDRFGIEVAPWPRTSFVHRYLLKIAKSQFPSDFLLEGLVEFLDDICPCGQKHQADAIRKLRKRQTSREGG